MVSVYTSMERTILQAITRTLHSRKTSCLTLVRSVMTTPARLAEVVEELKKNPYYEKYAQKISQLQKTSPEEFLSKIEKHGTEKSKVKTGEPVERQYTSLLQPKKNLDTTVDIGDEQLDKIMKVSLIQDKEPSDIKQIWETYHLQKDVIAATIPAKEFEILSTTGKANPTFLLPIPRSQGYEFVVCQFFRNTIHFTPLLNYQVHKENAPECLTLIHYTEFKDSKGIVLMRGEYDKNVLSSKEAQCLANLLQLYYCNKDPQKTQLLDKFTQRPDEFKHADLIKQIESLQL